MELLVKRDSRALAYAIRQSCADEAAVVAADEMEAGQRALLNLGHTFGHAIETGMGYGEWLHGEAVAAGMCMAASMSARMSWLSEEDVAQVTKLVERAGLPITPPRLGGARFKELMAVDKKVIAGQLRLVLLKGIGRAVVTSEFSSQALDQTLSDQ